MRSFAFSLVIAAFVVAGGASSQAQDAGDRSFGQFVLDAMDTGQTAESVATQIRTRSIEIRAEWGKEGAVTEEERRWYEHRDEIQEEKPGGGPPPWAPAHGYRRKFDAQREADLGSYVHRCLQQGTTGGALIIAIRAAIDRVDRGEAVDPASAHHHTTEHGARSADSGERSERSSSQQRSGKPKGKPAKAHN